MEDNFVLDRWEQIKHVVNDLELDVAKNASGNAAAGLRTRKGLRNLAKACTTLVRDVLKRDKEAKEARVKAEGKKPRPKTKKKV